MAAEVPQPPRPLWRSDALKAQHHDSEVEQQVYAPPTVDGGDAEEQDEAQHRDSEVEQQEAAPPTVDGDAEEQDEAHQDSEVEQQEAAPPTVDGGEAKSRTTIEPWSVDAASAMAALDWTDDTAGADASSGIMEDVLATQDVLADGFMDMDLEREIENHVLRHATDGRETLPLEHGFWDLPLQASHPHLSQIYWVLGPGRPGQQII